MPSPVLAPGFEGVTDIKEEIGLIWAFTTPSQGAWSLGKRGVHEDRRVFSPASGVGQDAHLPSLGQRDPEKVQGHHICALTIFGFSVPIPAMHAWLVNGHEFAVFFAAFIPRFEFLFHLRLVVGHQRLATLLDSLDLAGRISGVDAPLGQIFVTDSGKQFRV